MRKAPYATADQAMRKEHPNPTRGQYYYTPSRRECQDVHKDFDLYSITYTAVAFRSGARGQLY